MSQCKIVYGYFVKDDELYFGNEQEAEKVDIAPDRCEQLNMIFHIELRSTLIRAFLIQLTEKASDHIDGWFDNQGETLLLQTLANGQSFAISYCVEYDSDVLKLAVISSRGAAEQLVKEDE